MDQWPDWCHWELEFSAHVYKRMLDRGFNEVDLRQMLEDASQVRGSFHTIGRWEVETRHSQRGWIVIVEPLADESILLVVTAYPVG